MQLAYHLVDAFASRPFAGNPAAVVLLDAWPAAALMQAVAAELNLSETAFAGPEPGGGWRIRWFTPVVEVDLCGHATLATAHVLLARDGADEVRFASASGPLAVRRDGARLTLDFPSRPPAPVRDDALAARVAAALGAPPRELWRARDLVALYDRPDDVRGLQPDPARLAAVDEFGVLATAPAGPGALRDADVDFVSRCFFPQQGILEDPVTGSAHATLIPLWADRLGTPTLRARQVSRRTGELWCALRGDRVDIAGHAVTVARGELALPG